MTLTALHSEIMFIDEFEADIYQNEKVAFMVFRVDYILSYLFPDAKWQFSKESKAVQEKSESAPQTGLTASEKRALEVIRDSTFEQITIVKKDGEIERIEKIKKMDKTAKIVDLLKGVQYGELQVKIKDGNTVFYSVTESEKI